MLPDFTTLSHLLAATTADSAAVAAAGARGAAPGWVESLFAGVVIAGAVPAFWYYGRLARAAFARRGLVNDAGFSPVEAGVAAGLTTLLLTILVAGFASANATSPDDAKLPEGHVIVLGVLLDTAVKTLLVVGLVAGLVLRGQNPAEMFGLSRLRFTGVLLRGGGLLAAALPLVYLASFAADKLTGGADRHGPEEAVRLLSAARDPASRLAMVLAAVVVAPVVEEFIFRGYLYGTMRRYLGPVAGIVLNAALFAGIHLHVPSLAPLFVFAVCLTLAYERTGSLLVCMTMHALFNTVSVALLILGVGDQGG